MSVPASHYQCLAREMLRFHSDQSASDEELVDALFSLHATSVADESGAREESQLVSSRHGRFFTASALVAFGRIDFVLDVVDYYPEAQIGAREMAGVLPNLISPDLSALRDPKGTRAWLVEHAADLRWTGLQYEFEPEGREPYD